MGPSALYSIPFIALHHCGYSPITFCKQIHQETDPRDECSRKCRTIYRLTEFSEPLNSMIDRSEAYCYCLEAAPIFIAVILFNLGTVFVGRPRSTSDKLIGAPLLLLEKALNV